MALIKSVNGEWNEFVRFAALWPALAHFNSFVCTCVFLIATPILSLSFSSFFPHSLPSSFSLFLSISAMPANKTDFNSIFNKRFYYTFYSFYCVDSKRFRTIFYTKQAFQLFICFMLFSRCALAVHDFLKLFNRLQCVVVVVVVVLFVFLVVAIVDVSFLFIITFCFCCFGLFRSFVSSFIVIVFFKWRKFAAFIIPKARKKHERTNTKKNGHIENSCRILITANWITQYIHILLLLLFFLMTNILCVISVANYFAFGNDGSPCVTQHNGFWFEAVAK